MKPADPAYLLQPRSAYTLGPMVARVCEDAGFGPDPEQHQVLDVTFAESAPGIPAAFEVVLIATRRNMKSASFEQVLLGDLLVCHVPVVVWSAHEFSTSQVSFEHIAGLFESSPFLSRRVKRILTGNGSELIELKPTPRTPDGQMVRFRARTKAGGRGLGAPRLFLDEAFALESSHMGTLMPLMSTYPAAQIRYGSSAGLARSAVLRSLRDRGRPMDVDAEPRLAYIEHCDDLPGECSQGGECSHLYGVPGCRYDDVERHKRANPAVERGRITLAYIADERRALGRTAEMVAEFGRERLGYWDEPIGSVDEVAIDPDTWNDLQDVHSMVSGDPIFALDVAPRRLWSAIMAGGQSDGGRVHVEVTSRKGVVDHRPGTAWLMPRFKKLAKAYPGATVLLLAKSQAAPYAKKLEALGFDVVLVQMGDYPVACSTFVDLVDAGHLVHLGDIALTSAVESGVLVDVGEEQSRWGRRKSGSDISPLVGATLLAWHLESGGDVDPLNGIR